MDDYSFLCNFNYHGLSKSARLFSYQICFFVIIIVVHGLMYLSAHVVVIWCNKLYVVIFLNTELGTLILAQMRHFLRVYVWLCVLSFS